MSDTPINDFWAAAEKSGREMGYRDGYSDGFDAGAEVGAARVLLVLKNAGIDFDVLPPMPHWGDFASYQRRHRLNNDPCESRCDRCSRCIRAAWVVRYGGDFVGTEAVEQTVMQNIGGAAA